MRRYGQLKLAEVSYLNTNPRTHALTHTRTDIARQRCVASLNENGLGTQCERVGVSGVCAWDPSAYALNPHMHEDPASTGTCVQ
jgi:hypothetical protein